MHRILIIILISILGVIAYVVITGNDQIQYQDKLAFFRTEAKKSTLAQAYIRVGEKRDAYQHKLHETYKRSLELADFDPKQKKEDSYNPNLDTFAFAKR